MDRRVGHVFEVGVGIMEAFDVPAPARVMTGSARIHRKHFLLKKAGDKSA